ncbi:MAG: DUF2752 domain-containing protein [Bacteroidaceae bacterium]|nr:DUF2752 domain-containing protein [Bacteroidaceae bacterium]
MRKAVILPIIKLGIYIFIPIFLWFIPHEQIMSGESICLSKRFFGRECWGCGFTRATYLVLHGDFCTAWEYNHLIIITIPLITILWLCGIVRQTKLLIKEIGSND